MAIHRRRGKGILARIVERFAKPAPQPANIEVEIPAMGIGTPTPATASPRPASMDEEINTELTRPWVPREETSQGGVETTLNRNGRPAIHERRLNSRLTSEAFRRMRTGGEETAAEPPPWTGSERAEFARITDEAFERLPQPPDPYSYAPSLSELQLRTDLASMQSLGAASSLGVQGLGNLGSDMTSTSAAMGQEHRAAILDSLLGAANAAARMSIPPATHGPSYLRPKPSR